MADEACLGPHVESIRFYDVEPAMIVNLTHRNNIRTLGLNLRRRDNNRLWDEKTGEPFKAPMANLFTRISQILINLTLWISLRSSSVFIPLVSSIPGLHTLSLNLNVTRSLQKGFSQLLTPPIRHSDIKNLRVLSIISFDTGRFDEDDEDNGTWAGFDPGLADALIQSLTIRNPLKELESLSFSCYMPYHESYLGPLLQSAVSARDIHASGADGMIPTSLRMERQLMPRLQSLTVPSLALYSWIDAPNLIDLEFNSDKMIGIMPVETNDTTHLQKLTLPANLMNDAGISMQSLWNSKSIKFISGICPLDITTLSRLESVEFSDGGEAANEFLLKILESPEACPQLYTIAISRYPLWELLFEVLRKRNSSGLQCITQITLPRLPVLQLLWRLVRLLGGETDVFTNRDVDEVIAKRVACPQILCCLRCIQAGYGPCMTLSQNPDHGRVDSPDFQNILDLDYPMDKEPISASKLWSGWRNYQFPSSRDNHRADNGETYQCRQFYLARSVDITEYTLDGTFIPPWISSPAGGMPLTTV